MFAVGTECTYVLVSGFMSYQTLAKFVCMPKATLAMNNSSHIYVYVALIYICIYTQEVDCLIDKYYTIVDTCFRKCYLMYCFTFLFIFTMVKRRAFFMSCH